MVRRVAEGRIGDAEIVERIAPAAPVADFLRDRDPLVVRTAIADDPVDWREA
jgi:hypothetical protein